MAAELQESGYRRLVITEANWRGGRESGLLDSFPLPVVGDESSIRAPRIHDVAFAAGSERDFRMAAAHGILRGGKLDIRLGAVVCPPHDQNLDLSLHKELLGEGETETNLSQLNNVSFAEPALRDLLAVHNDPISTPEVGDGERTVAGHVNFGMMAGDAVICEDDVVVAPATDA